jgi:ribonuclease-3
MDAQISGQKIFNPWNAKNKDISSKDISSILRAYNCPIKLSKPEIFSLACIHKSYVDRPDIWAEQMENEPMIMADRPDDCMPLKVHDNEELEFAGDSALGSIVAFYLSKRYKGKGEGFLTRLRTRIVNNKTLGQLALKIGFAPWLIISRHVEEVCDGRRNLRILGSMLESWIGAIMEHEGEESGHGYAASRRFVISVLEKHIDFVDLITDDTNYKDQLLRMFQAKYHVPPKYKEVEVIGPPHDRVFTMGVIDVSGNIIAKATARNKKVAEQEASRIALDYFI